MTALFDLNVTSLLAMHRGISIALSGMLIVFFVLILITLFLEALPHCLEILAKFLPETEEVHVAPLHKASHLPEDEAVVAGLGFVLHTELQKQLQSPPSPPKI